MNYSEASEYLLQEIIDRGDISNTYNTINLQGEDLLNIDDHNANQYSKHIQSYMGVNNVQPNEHSNMYNFVQEQNQRQVQSPNMYTINSQVNPYTSNATSREPNNIVPFKFNAEGQSSVNVRHELNRYQRRNLYLSPQEDQRKNLLSPQGDWRRRFISPQGYSPGSLPVRPSLSPVTSRHSSGSFAHQACSYFRRVRMQTPSQKISPIKYAPRSCRYSPHVRYGKTRYERPWSINTSGSSYNADSSFESRSQGSSPNVSGSNVSEILSSTAHTSSPGSELHYKVHDHSNASWKSEQSVSSSKSGDYSFTSWRSDENSFISENIPPEVEPQLRSYQLVGDSQLLRFAEQLLHKEAKVVNGFRLLGLCVSGQKIEDLLNRVKQQMYPVSDKVVVLIGTNDMLHNTSLQNMCQRLRRLLFKLGKYAKRIVLLTLPPVPKLQQKSDHWEKLAGYNEFIKTMAKGESVAVADVSNLYFADNRNIKMEFFERYYGDSSRVDLIHLNRLGLETIQNFLLNNQLLV